MPRPDTLTPAGVSDLAERARVAESRGEEVRQLLFTVQQDLREFAETRDDAVLDSARSASASALALVQQAVQARRLDLADLDRPEATALARSGDAAACRPPWTVAEAWVVLARDGRVLAASDRACRLVHRTLHTVVGASIAAVSGVAADVVDARLDEAARRGLSTATVALDRPPHRAEVMVQRLPDARAGGPTFLVLFRRDAAG